MFMELWYSELVSDWLQEQEEDVINHPNYNALHVDALALWVKNTSVRYEKIMVARDDFRAGDIAISRFCDRIKKECRHEVQNLINAEEYIDSISPINVLGAALQLTHYYLFVYSD